MSLNRSRHKYKPHTQNGDAMFAVLLKEGKLTNYEKNIPERSGNTNVQNDGVELSPETQ